MKKSVPGIFATAALAGILGVSDVSAQSIRRIRQSIDRATGGQTAAPTPARPAAPAAPVMTPEQAAAEQKRQKESAKAAEAKVVPFLKERVEGGSADAALDLAKRYEIGKGVTVDPKESRRLYGLAAERGNSDAKKWLAENPAPKDKPSGAPVVSASKPTAVETKPTEKSKAKVAVPAK